MLSGYKNINASNNNVIPAAGIRHVTLYMPSTTLGSYAVAAVYPTIERSIPANPDEHACPHFLAKE